ncbi:MAG: tRNA pseudouridine(55) synthase TruB [Patescibacteria group bacterium]
MKIEGIFALDKPLGITSQRAVQIVKYWARRNTGNKKIKVGHAGTLDPLASGVLVVGIGREYTKDLDNIVKSEKEYLAEITLGEVSETDDAEGQKTIVNKDRIPSEKEIEKSIKKFTGNIKQIPSAYSAVKIDGEEAYKKARRGEDVEMKEREVFIKNIDLLSYEYPKIKIRVTCGKGTYIRTLARDIGDILETGAFLSGLERTRVGDFLLKDAKDLKEFSMNIAIHATELDNEKIDGTRVYISEVLNRLGSLASDDDFYLYHKDEFNDKLKPKETDNYKIKKIFKFPMWTQTVFAWNIFSKKPDVLWMPFHNIPFLKNKKTKIVITIHDLAFKLFPETFTKKDLWKLDFLTDNAVKKSDRIIAVSKSTKKDLLKFYPWLNEKKITVVHHGIDEGLWQKEITENEKKKVLTKYNLDSQDYIVHTGTIQPRKNLVRLVEAFEILRKKKQKLKLVLIGGNGWLYENIRKRASESEFASDIIFTGNIDIEDVRILMKNAKVFVLPSLYEGFGLPGLEAMAVGVPVVAAKNSSIPEVLGDTAIYFDAENSKECAEKIKEVINNTQLRGEMIEKGLKRVKKFTWEKCARNTLRVLRK